MPIKAFVDYMANYISKECNCSKDAVLTSWCERLGSTHYRGQFVVPELGRIFEGSFYQEPYTISVSEIKILSTSQPSEK